MATLKPRRFRFSLRTLFVVVTLAAVATAWAVYQINWIRQRREVIAAGQVIAVPLGRDVPPKAPWPLWLFGEPGCKLLAVSTENKVAAIRNSTNNGYTLPTYSGNEPYLKSLTEQDRELLARTKQLFPEAQIALSVEVPWEWPGTAGSISH